MILSAHSWEAPLRALPKHHLFSSSSCELCSVVALLLGGNGVPEGLPALVEVTQLACGGAKTPTRTIGFHGTCGRNVGALRCGQAWRIYLPLRLDPRASVSSAW